MLPGLVAQLTTEPLRSLRRCEIGRGLLISFNVKLLKKGIYHLMCNLSQFSHILSVISVVIYTTTPCYRANYTPRVSRIGFGLKRKLSRFNDQKGPHILNIRVFLIVESRGFGSAEIPILESRGVYHHGSSAIIPPQRNGQYHTNIPDCFQERNKSLLEIKGLGGDEDARKFWKKLKGYHRRSLAETGMYRFKTLFGRDLRCRTFQGQQSEAYVKAKALNIMTHLGMPQSVRKVG